MQAAMPSKKAKPSLDGAAAAAPRAACSPMAVVDPAVALAALQPVDLEAAVGELLGRCCEAVLASGATTQSPPSLRRISMGGDMGAGAPPLPACRAEAMDEGGGGPPSAAVLPATQPISCRSAGVPVQASASPCGAVGATPPEHRCAAPNTDSAHAPPLAAVVYHTASIHTAAHKQVGGGCVVKEQLFHETTMRFLFSIAAPDLPPTSAPPHPSLPAGACAVLHPRGLWHPPEQRQQLLAQLLERR